MDTLINAVNNTWHVAPFVLFVALVLLVIIHKRDIALLDRECDLWYNLARDYDKEANQYYKLAESRRQQLDAIYRTFQQQASKPQYIYPDGTRQSPRNNKRK